MNLTQCIHRTPAAGLVLLALGAAALAADPAFESPAALRASELLPRALVESVHHRVHEDVELDGGLYVFGLETPFGVERVRSLALLRVRLHEIHTMAQAAAQLERGEDWRRAVEGRRGVGGESVLDILANPLGTATELADNFGDNLERTLSGDYLRPLPQKTPAYDAGDRGDPGPYARSVAAQLGLDVYSTSAAVQAFLAELAAARAAGRLGEAIATITPASPGGPVRARDVATLRFETVLKNEGRDALRERNAAALAAMGVSVPIAARFLDNTALSPRHRTYIVGYLQALHDVGGRTAFVEAAAGAADEAEALGYERTARLLAREHAGGAGIARLEPGRGSPFVHGRDGTVALYFAVDRLLWNADTAAALDALAARAAQAPRAEIVITGTFSPRAREALEARGIAWREAADR